MASERQPGEDIWALVEQARQGSAEALGWLLEHYRPYLLQISFEELDSDLRPKESPSDLVQKSFLEASQGFADFQGSSPEGLKGWLRQILLNNVRDAREHYNTDKRQLGREVGELSEKFTAGFPDEVTPPSQVAIRNEQAQELEAGLAKLDDNARRLIVLRHQEGRSFTEIADALNITEHAARKRWARAVEELRRLTPGSRSPETPG